MTILDRFLGARVVATFAERNEDPGVTAAVAKRAVVAEQQQQVAEQALAGLVGFVGLLVPHVARWLVGHDVRASFAVSLLLGAVVALYADQVARLAFMPSEVPVGMISAALGAPIMIYVARHTKWS